VPHLIPLNRSERAYAALEGVAGSVSQVYEMTFERSLDPALVRSCVRALVSAYPRTRTRLAVGVFSTSLEVLDDTDPLLEPLFDEVWSVVQGVAANDERLHEYRNALLAEPFSLGRSLPVRFRFADHPTRPTLFMIVHHLVCDGRGMIQMIDALLGALAGKPIEPVAIDVPFMRAALWPRGLMARFRAALIDWRRMRAQKAAARGVSLIDPLTPLSAFTAPRVLRYTPKLSVKKLVAAAKAQDTSLNALTLAAVTLVLARRARATETEDTREVAVRISVDVRPYFDPPRPNAFGNFVASFMVRSRRFSDAAALLADVGAQLKEGVRRFKDHERGFGLLLDEIGTWIGLRLYSLAARRLKTRGKLAPMSAHYSTVGSVDFFARHDAGLCEFSGYAPNTGLFVTSVSFRDELRMGIIYPAGGLTPSEVNAVAVELEGALAELSQLEPAAEPATVSDMAPRPAAAVALSA
jgi:NRPS condensation-like uncharacterized protein